MTKLENILGQFEDFELAFLVRYKYDTYLENSRKMIDSELRKRRLTKEKIESLISQTENNRINDGVLRCPRCSSNKIAKDQVEFWNTFSNDVFFGDYATYDGLIGKQTYEDKLTCMICDYILIDPNSEGFLGVQEKLSNWIRKMFKNK